MPLNHRWDADQHLFCWLICYLYLNVYQWHTRSARPQVTGSTSKTLPATQPMRSSIILGYTSGYRPTQLTEALFSLIQEICRRRCSYL